MGMRHDKPGLDKFSHDSEFREIPGWPGYVACKDGTVWSNKLQGRWREIGNNKPSDFGYWFVRLIDRERDHYDVVHRIVMLAFVGPCPDGMEVRHLNGNPGDNRLENLAYGTPVENMADKRIHGTQPHGETSHFAKLTDEIVMDIRRQKSEGATVTVLAERFGVTTGTITNVIKGKRWAHLPTMEYTNLCYKVEDSIILAIRAKFKNGESTKSLSEQYSIPEKTVRAYVSGKLRRSILSEDGTPVTAPRERPIPITVDMVNAILDGRKSQIRKAIKGKWSFDGNNGLGCGYLPPPCRYGVAGDRLWVREVHYVWASGCPGGDGLKVHYRATTPDAPVPVWTGPTKMPRWASRIILEITDVRHERLQSISLCDAKSEGITEYGHEFRAGMTEYELDEWRNRSTIENYASEWDRADTKYSWASNPWVWVITFRRIES